jgi:hypothetical protein
VEELDMALKHAFSNVKDNLLSRRWGGHSTGVADPYVTGYHHIWFDRLPTISTKSEMASGDIIKGDMQKILAATCTGVTPPGGTLNKIEFTGLGGVKWAVPGNLDYGNSISIKFQEMQGLPVSMIMHNWIKLMRDYRTGVSNLDDKGQSQDIGYSKTQYSAVLYYWTTAPDGHTIEYYAAYDGVFPTKDPSDLFASDVESIGKLDVEIEFNCDYVWHEDWVYNKIAKTFQAPVSDSKKVITDYGEVGLG